MTASNRLSFLISPPEGAYGSGNTYNGVWIAPPPGAYISTTHSRETTRVNAAGTKQWDTIAYGKLAGSWTINFMLDYKYLEPLMYVFEKYTCATSTTSGNTTYYLHTFEKENGGRVPSFSVRRVILNEMAGGPDGSDEIIELYGCVCRNITFQKAAGASQTAVTMTGFYADEMMAKGSLDSTDYDEYDGKIAEFMCMFIGTTTTTDTYVANTDSLSVQIGNNADPIYNTCSPVASSYYEGLTNNEFTTSCYSTDPKNYKQRVYSGGNRNNVLHPLRKGLTPISDIRLVSYDKSMIDDGYSTYADAISASDYTTTFEISKCVIKSLTWPKADSSIIQDNISSAACKDIKLKIKSDVQSMHDASNNIDFSNSPNKVDKVNCLIDIFYNDDNAGTGLEKYAYCTIKTNESTISNKSSAPEYEGYTLDGFYTKRENGTKVINVSGDTWTLVSGVEDYTDSNGKWERTKIVPLYAHWTATTSTTSE